LPDVSEQFKPLIQRNKKWDGCNVPTHDEWVKINTEQVFIYGCPLGQGKPDHDGQCHDANEHHDYLKKYC